jgi:hypothetical protein
VFYAGKRQEILMSSKRRQFRRRLGEKRYHRLFIISVEGTKTEPQYFNIFNDQRPIIQVNCLKGKHSSPQYVLKRMKRHLRDEALKSSDEAWLVVDKDQWTDGQLTQLHTWSRQAANHGLALSNPKFEYWLLLHFEDGTGINSTNSCTQRLRQHLPDYIKGINPSKITKQMIENAIQRAKLRDTPPCQDWPKIMGGTTVYRLVKRY